MSTHGPGLFLKGVVHLAFLHNNAVFPVYHRLQLRHVASPTSSDRDEGQQGIACGLKDAQCNISLPTVALTTPVGTNELQDSYLPWRGVLVPFNSVDLKRTHSWRFPTLLRRFLTHATNVYGSSTFACGAILLCPRRLAHDVAYCLCRRDYVCAITGLNCTLCYNNFVTRGNLFPILLRWNGRRRRTHSWVLGGMNGMKAHCLCCGRFSQVQKKVREMLALAGKTNKSANTSSAGLVQSFHKNCVIWHVVELHVSSGKKNFRWNKARTT